MEKKKKDGSPALGNHRKEICYIIHNYYNMLMQSQRELISTY